MVRFFEEVESILETIYEDEPTVNVQEGEIIAGEATEEMKGLWSLKNFWNEQADANDHKAQRCTPSEQKEQKKFAEEALSLRKKADLVYEIFWITVKDHFMLWNGSEVGIRRGWRIIYRELPKVLPVSAPF